MDRNNFLYIYPCIVLRPGSAIWRRGLLPRHAASGAIDSNNAHFQDISARSDLSGVIQREPWLGKLFDSVELPISRIEN